MVVHSLQRLMAYMTYHSTRRQVTFYSRCLDAKDFNP